MYAKISIVMLMAALLVATCVARPNAAVEEERNHQSKRQREIFLSGGSSLDTRDLSEFHRDEKYEQYKQKSGTSSSSSDVHNYLVHFKIGVTEESGPRALESRVNGVVLTHYMPHNTFVMHATEEQAHAVREETDLVLWVGAYLPEHRMPDTLADPSRYAKVAKAYAPGELTLRVAPIHADALEALAGRWTGELYEQEAARVVFDLSGSRAGAGAEDLMSVRIVRDADAVSPMNAEQLDALQEQVHRVGAWLSHRAELVWVEPKQRFTSHNAYARGLVQSGIVGPPGEIYTALGITGAGDGSGDVVALGDTGVNMASCFFSDSAATPFDTVNTAHRKVIGYDTSLGDREDSFGHGTFVAGQLIGETTGDMSLYNGHATGAKLYVMDMNAGGLQLNVPDNTGSQLFQPPLDAGAKVQLYPWGSNAQFYGATAAQVDRFAHNNPLFLAIYSAGNDGDINVDGTTTISSPSLAKNVISVGCAQSARDSFLDNRPADEFEQRAQYWHTQLCGEDLTAYNDQRFCASVGQPTPCRDFQDQFCSSFSGRASECCGQLVYLNVRCCEPVMRRQIAAFPSLFNEFSLAWFSSTGPTIDGRIKPDVVAPGRLVYSAAGDGSCDFEVFEGSSYSSAVVAGGALLIRQYFMDGSGRYVPMQSGAAAQFEPSAALVKAMLVNSGQPLRQQNNNDQQHVLALEQTLPNDRVGFGVVRLDRVLRTTESDFNLLVVDREPFERLPTNGVNETSQVEFGPLTKRFCIDIPESSQYIKLSVVWSDPEAFESAGQQIIDNVDVILVDDVGFEYRSNFGVTLDAINTVEQIYVKLPPAGRYSILVHPTHYVGSNPPVFSMVVTGQFSLSTTCHEACPFGCGLSGLCHDVGEAGAAVAGLCTCIPPFVGPDCTLTPCIPNANGDICSGNGYCNGDDGSCICNRFFRGADCSQANPTGVPEENIVVVTAEDDDVAPGIVAGIAIACFIFGLCLGAGLAVWLTVRFLLARQKKRLAQFQSQLQNRQGASGADLLESDSD
jgi:Subtilase family